MAGTDAGMLKQNDALSVESVCVTVAGIFLLLRLYVQAIILRRISASDFLIVAAWLLFLANMICDIYSNKYGMWNPKIQFTASGLPDFDAVFPDEKLMIKVLKILYGSTPLYYVALYLVKAAILLLYFRLFPLDHIKLRRALYFTTAFTALGSLLMICFNLFWCLPVWRNWARNPEDRCLAVASVPTYLVTAAFHLITDLLIYALPFFLLRSLAETTSRRKLWGIGVMFSLGFICIAITIARIILVIISASFPLIGATSASEMAAGIVVACCPPLKWFWSSRIEHIRKSGGSAGCCVAVGIGSGGGAGSRSRRSGGGGAGSGRGSGGRNARSNGSPGPRRIIGSRADKSVVRNEKMLGKLRISLFTKDSGFNRSLSRSRTGGGGSKYADIENNSPNWTVTNTAGTEGTLSLETLDEVRSVSAIGVDTVNTRTAPMFGGLAPRERSLSVDMPPAQHGGVGPGSGWRKWLGIGNPADEQQQPEMVEEDSKGRKLGRGALGTSTFGGRRTRTNNGGGTGAGTTTYDIGASTIADREWEQDHQQQQQQHLHQGQHHHRHRGKSIEEREADRVREMLNIQPSAAVEQADNLNRTRDLNDAEMGIASRVHIRIHAAHDFSNTGDSDAHVVDGTVPRDNDYDISPGLGRGSFYADDEMMEEYRPRRIECLVRESEKENGKKKGGGRRSHGHHHQRLQSAKNGGPIGSDFGGATFLTGPSSPGSCCSSLEEERDESANYGSSIFGSSV